MSPTRRSTLMTDAPWSASRAAVSGPETTAERSRTLNPERGPVGTRVTQPRIGLIGGQFSLEARIFSPIVLTFHGASDCSFDAIGVICHERRDTLFPATRNCRPETSFASSVQSHTTAGETFSGGNASFIGSGRMSSVSRDIAVGARMLTVMPYLTPSSQRQRMKPAVAAFAAP